MPAVFYGYITMIQERTLLRRSVSRPLCVCANFAARRYLASVCGGSEFIALVCFLISAPKHIINLVQLWRASKILVGVDFVDRAKTGEVGKDVKA